MQNHIKQAIHTLKAGGIISYPTESVYGIGCDPFNETACTTLCNIKQRQPEQGFILVASNWEQIKNLTLPVPNQRQKYINHSWPGATTWVFPASVHTPKWLLGPNQTIALRISNHPEVISLCQAFNAPIVSTSANKRNKSPANSYTQVIQQNLHEKLYVLPGKTGGLAPTKIINALTGEIIR